MEKIKNSDLLISIALIIIGVLFCALRSQFVSALLTVVGVLLIIVGVYDVVRKQYVQGAIEIVVGIIIIACGWTIVDITLLILGIVFVVYSVYSIVSQIPAIKNAKGIDKALVILNPVCILIFGVILIVARWYMIDAVFIVIGVLAIISGVAMLAKQLKK